jgi:hypothetical protein
MSMTADRGFFSGLPPTITSSAPAAPPQVPTVPASASTLNVTTDSNGTFVFRNVNPGSFRLTVAGNGFVPQEYAQTNRFQPINPIVLAAGQTLTGVAIRLIPTGNVSGRVLDLNGQPLAGVPVNLYRPAYNPTGEWNPTVVATARTNDRGEYRIFWIAPGRHYVLAGGNAAQGRPVNSINNDVLDNFSYGFCPQGTDIENASAIDVKPGSEISGCDFRLGPQSFYRIYGKLVDSRTGQPPGQGSVSIASRSPIGARGFGGGRVYYDPTTGSFEATDVLPGTYNLTSTIFSGVPGPLGALSASAIVRVINSDVRDVLLSIAPGPSVSGQVISDAPLPAGSRLQIRLVPSSAAIGVQQVSAPVNPDGTFTFQAGSFRMGPADYRVSMTNVIGQSGLAAGWHLTGAKLGEIDAYNTPARFPSDSPLNVYLSSKGGQVSGTVRNDKQQPVSSVYAVLIPDALRLRPDLFQTSMSDRTGRFNFPNVGPGNYKLFAWENIEGLWFDPEWLKDFEQKGVAVRIVEGSRETVELTSIPNWGAQ